jgi:DNA-binding response OmpR family regulator
MSQGSLSRVSLGPLARHLSEEQIARLRAELADAKAALDEAHARIAELELTRPAHGIDLRRACVPGLTHTQATVLAILADGRAHTWWQIAELLEMLIGSRSKEQESLVRAVVSKVRSYLRTQGFEDAICVRNRVGYWIAADKLEAVKGLFIHS